MATSGSELNFRSIQARTSPSCGPLIVTSSEQSVINLTIRKLLKIPIIGIFEIKITVMAKNTSILLGDYFDKFIHEQIQTGKFSSASEVVRAALRMFEHEETKKTELIKELKKGEKSGFVKNFNREAFLENLHQKHVSK
ncbi:type II toxin-antitoxin system ParD family antitoxin [Sphingobacterium composti Ten et al. 2007 non Yoo et al. 2007]|uniref:type II toxin-antitoxin system ParD family antitoxin n=1 Tax=Sphingobacterium composti TaxID=363260 RepID=UPI001F17B8D1|nr:type II toxin-antitoxin system ParD family antitoxin [Sphingobacterium composti Ten et al. 2007 non Yoo et al. 2007]